MLVSESFKDEAIRLEASDKLAQYKNQFHIPKNEIGEPLIYFCGNSLGLQPLSTHSFIVRELENWKSRGVQAHFIGEKPWVNYATHAKPTLAKLLGAEENEVAAMNNLTTNLHLALATFYNPKGKRNKVLIEKGAFPSDFYAIHSQITWAGLSPQECLIEIDAKGNSEYLLDEEIIEKIYELGDTLSLVLLPGIHYYTGQLFDMAKITTAAHEYGAYAGFDLAHAIGNIPMTLHKDGIDFAVWCSYKYLNSGPGGVGGLFIHQIHGQNKSLKRLSGWWGHETQERFKMDNIINPIPSVEGWQLSNPNILSCAALMASLEMFEKVGVDLLREKSMLLTAFLEKTILSSDVLKNHIRIITPQNPNKRGCQLSLFLMHRRKEIYHYLLANGAIVDWREPNVIRVAPTPFYNSYTDVLGFVAKLEDTFKNESIH